MWAIEVNKLRKDFRVQQNREGLGGALRDLFKREYRSITAVNEISFRIPRGEICGYIGENGAGKSTTIKMLTGILVPTSGEISVNGLVPYKDREAFVRGIGVVFGQRSQLWWDIGVIESFRLLKRVYRVNDQDFRKRLDELVDRLQLADILNRPVRKLSLGQRMRCELAASLLHNPSILFLDEPTIGLDVMVKAEIRDFLKSMNQRYETTILLTTHDLQDIEALCSRVIMLDDGNIIYDGGLEELKARWGRGKEIVLQLSQPAEPDFLSRLTADMNVEWSMENDLVAHIWVPFGQTNVSEVLGRVVGAVEIEDIRIIETQTDDIIREIYKTGHASADHAELAAAGDDPLAPQQTEPSGQGESSASAAHPPEAANGQKQDLAAAKGSDGP